MRALPWRIIGRPWNWLQTNGTSNTSGGPRHATAWRFSRSAREISPKPLLATSRPWHWTRPSRSSIRSWAACWPTREISTRPGPISNGALMWCRMTQPPMATWRCCWPGRTRSTRPGRTFARPWRSIPAPAPCICNSPPILPRAATRLQPSIIIVWRSRSIRMPPLLTSRLSGCFSSKENQARRPAMHARG